MRYAFKPHAFGREIRVQVTAESIQVIDAEGRQKRQISWRDLKCIQVFDRGVAKDPKRGKFTMVDFTLKPRFGRPIRICSASYLRPGRPIEATHQREAFGLVCDAIKRRVADVNPDLPLIIGSRAVSLALGVVSMMGVGLCVFALVAAITANNSLSEIWPLLLLAMLVGIVMSLTTAQSAVSYWPSSRPIHGDRS